MKSSSLLTAAAALLLLVLSAPAEAWLVGPCSEQNKHYPGSPPGPFEPESGSSTLGFTTVIPPCYPSGCFVIISPKQTSVKTAIIDYRVPGKPDDESAIPPYSGLVKVAVISNDTRLGRVVIEEKELGTLSGTSSDGRGLKNWYLPFTGLKPAHYYALVIYGTDGGYGLEKPFSRKCFLTAKTS